MIEIQVNNLVKSFEVGKNVLDGLTFQVDQGERVGLLGRNGAGKTTLFKILTGELDYDEGTVVVGQGRRVGLISQIPVYPAGYTVEDVLRSAFARLQSLAEEMRALEARMAAGESDPAIPLGGAELKGVDGLEARYGDTEIDTLVRGGVTPVEQAAGVVSVVRGVTTRTKTGEAADATWRELTTIRIVDDVIPTVRDALRARFRRAKNTEQSRGAIRSQVVLELENRKEREIISGYDNVAVSADPDNPTVCQVEFSFSAAQGLNQIWLTAHITV